MTTKRETDRRKNNWSTLYVECEEFDKFAEEVESLKRRVSAQQNQINKLNKQIVTGATTERNSAGT